MTVDGRAGPELLADAPLLEVLEQAQAHGFLGPRPVIEQARHALAFLPVPTDEPQQALDLGSGGGIPGLVLARYGWPRCRWQLVEAGARRSNFLRQAIAALRLDDRVEVVQGRAEDVGRDPQRRHVADLVVARSFGPPAVTAECAAPLVAMGGMVVVSEPPSSPDDRWPSAGLALVGLAVERTISDPVHLVGLRALTACPARYPRRVGVPEKRPLF